MYGVNCTEKCGSCLEFEQCNHINGTCMKGCDMGFHGSDCIEGNWLYNHQNKNKELHNHFNFKILFKKKVILKPIYKNKELISAIKQSDQLIWINCCLKLTNFVQNVQTGRMDTTVSTTVASIVRCLGYVTRKQDIVTVKWDGNQIHVTQVRLN